MADRQTDEYIDDEENVDEVDVTAEETDDEDDNFEILVEGRDPIPEETPPQEGPSKEELLREVAELRQRQSTLDTQLGDRSALESGFDKLSKLLEGRDSRPQPTGPQETWDDVKKRVSKSFYDDPAAAIEEMLRYAIQTEVAPAFHQTQEQLSKTATLTSKQVAAANPTNKLILDTYGSEVEDVVKGLQPGPDVYERACREVGFRHLTDLVTLQAQEIATTNGGTASKPKSNVQPTTVSPSRGTAKPAKRRVLTAKQRDFADRHGLTYEAAWRYFNENS